ncbi:heavy metal translocating P-type ATPase [Bifidobacterium boum]|uniref:heavy metal translocating P-type ATPase n=1 Tax=Bifidobacterium boum TaxID=78343 RepID=UPI00243330D5|nr:cation-translocating P-type ATPase [Bifidobacterium boum]MCI5860805.1 cation-translocating P-type ATPase [Bifidobacterium boum]
MQTFVLRHKPQITVISGVLIVIGLVARFAFHSQPVYAAAFIAASIIGVLPILVQAVQALRVRVMSIDVLVSIAVFGAFLIGSWDESVIVTFLFLVGGQIERYTLNQTRSAINALTDMAPQSAAVRRADGTFETVPVDDVRVGDIVKVTTGDRIPVDGTVISGTGLVNESAITGEPIPVGKAAGSSASAGTLLDDGMLTIRADMVGEDTTFGKIIELVENAQDSKSKEERFIDRFAAYYTPAVLIIAVIVGLATRRIDLAITMLVLGCPGALVIGVPVSNMAGIGNGARHGVLIKGSEVTHRLSSADTFVFDKTGTITVGVPQVTDVRRYDEDGTPVANDTGNGAGGAHIGSFEETKDVAARDSSVPDASALDAGSDPAHDDVVRYLVGVESQSQHPLAKAIVRHFGDIPVPQVDQVSVVTGGGISAVHDNHRILVGSPRFLEADGIALTSSMCEDASELEMQGDSLVAVAVDGSIRLLLGIRDRLRLGVADDITRLRRLGAKTIVLLSGDNQRAVDLMTAKLGFDRAIGGLLPDEKAAVISGLRDDGHRVVFVGDGINDSPSIALADVGIAMGNGADVAIDTSDVVLADSDFSRLPHAYGLAKHTVRNMRENIAIAVGTVALLLSGLVLTTWLTMAVGMFVHEASVLAVILNGMRLLRYRTDRNHGTRHWNIRKLDTYQGQPRSVIDTVAA